jgi:hypothetical protein
MMSDGRQQLGQPALISLRMDLLQDQLLRIGRRIPLYIFGAVLAFPPECRCVVWHPLDCRIPCAYI